MHGGTRRADKHEMLLFGHRSNRPNGTGNELVTAHLWQAHGMKIGVLGATGPAGSGLAARLASIGHAVLLGSRERERSVAAVEQLRTRWGDLVDGLVPADNAEAAAQAELVVVAVPWEAAARTALEHAGACADKVVISMANALRRVDRQFEAVLSPRRSIAAEVQAAMPKALVAAAFQHIPASAFGNLDAAIEGDVIVCSNHDKALRTVCELIASIPSLRPFEGGSLSNAMGVEAFAAVLLSVNLRYKVKAGLHLTGTGLTGTGPQGGGSEAP